MQTTTDEERRPFLTAGTRTGKLATVRPDGRPHVVPIWLVLDGDDLVFSMGDSSAKAADIRRDPRVAVCVDAEALPYAYVEVRGVASVGAILDEMLPWSTRIGGRYMGADRAEEFGRRNAVEGELLVRVTPDRIVALKGIAD